MSPVLGRQRQKDLCEFKDSLVYRVIPGQRYTENLSQKVKVKIKEREVKIKSHKDGKYTRILLLYAIMLSLNCLNAEEGATAAKRLLFINAAELTQDRYFENTLASKLKSKGKLLWRRDFAFVSTENERLWIYSELRKIIFDQGRPTEKFPVGTDGLDV